MTFHTKRLQKLLRIWYNEVDGFIKTLDGVRYLVFFGCAWVDMLGHDSLMMSMNLSAIAVLKLEGSNYHCIIRFISKMKLWT